jgi:hypothetical protein
MHANILRLILILSLLAGACPVRAQGTAFTYQGQLDNGTNPVTGLYNFKFDAFNASTGGSVIGGPVTNTAVPVTNGLLTTIIDFGTGVFTGPTMWLQVEVTTNGGTNFTSLEPRQELTPTPYAIYAESASNLLGTVALAQLPGTVVTNNEASVTLSNVTLSGILILPSISTIDAGGTSLLRDDGNNNFYAGPGAGSPTNSGSANTAIGSDSLQNNSNGTNNTAIGYASLGNNTNGSYNTATGERTLFNNSSGNDNTADGRHALQGNTTGSDNTAVGYGALASDQVGSGNIALGSLAGSAYNSNASNNIDIGNTGTQGENYTIHIGDPNIHTNTFIAGVINGNGGGLTNLNASQVGGLAASNFWQTTGNAGTSPGVNFLGTSDDEPLILRADGQVGLQLQYSSVSVLSVSQSSINLIGGYWNNTISSGVVGGTIAGGGGASRIGVNNYSSPNTVTGSYGTVGGGLANTAGNSGTVPGGSANVAGGEYSFAAGQNAQALNQGAFVWADSESPVFASTANDQFLIRAQGGVGIGTASPEQGLSVNTGLNLDQAGLNAGFLNNGNTNGNGLTFGISSGEGIASQRLTGAGGGNQYGLDFYTAFTRRMSIAQNGAIRTDGNPLLCTTNNGSSYANDGLYNGSFGISGINDGSGPGLWGYSGGSLGSLSPATMALSWDNSGDVNVNGNLWAGGSLVGFSDLVVFEQAYVYGNYVEIYGGSSADGDGDIDAYIGGSGSGSDVQIGSFNSNITDVGFWNTGSSSWMHISCSGITCNGGSDLAEPFKITAGKQAVPQGAVVVIDEENPGHLKISDQSYDTHVAGVVSGANGINPGIQMMQQGLLDGGKNVALTGRVYVQADTANGTIKPGDLLTTSSTPGFAMKVTDHARAAGAILGKAMTGLSEGKGMVLVLVTLQ